jgi:lysophospholipase L1-like esterase
MAGKTIERVCAQNLCIRTAKVNQRYVIVTFSFYIHQSARDASMPPSRFSMKTQRQIGLLRYLVIITAIGACFLALIEIGAWILNPGRYENPPDVTADAWMYSDAIAPRDTVWLKEFVDEFCRSYHAHWTSYVYYRRDPFVGKHITVDSNGIRSTVQPDVRAPAGTRPARIFLFGGSTMWGTGSRDGGTIPSALARLIGGAGEARPVEVVNMGESGYVSTQSVLKLALELRRGNVPDLVIMYDGVNDVFSAFQNQEPGLPQNEFNRAREFNLLKDGGKMRELGVNDFFKRTVTASVLQGLRSAASSVTPPAPADTGLAEGAIRLYRGNLAILGALSREYGFRYEAYWQPVVFSRKDPSRYEQLQSNKQQHARPLFLEAYGRVERDSSLGANAHFHNLSRIFDEAGIPVYLDFCHVSEAGNTIIAQKMYGDIRGWLHPQNPR